MDPFDIAIVASIASALTILGVIVVRIIASRRFRDFYLGRIISLLGILAIVMLAMLLLIALVACASILGFVWWCVFILVISEWVRKRRAVEQNALLWLLTVSAERSMPLIPAIEAFAREHRGQFGRIARRLATLIEAGDSLPDALGRCPGALPAGAIPMIRIGCASGDLPSALRLAADHHEDPHWTSLFGKIAYLLAVSVFGISILTFLMLKIVPSFQKIFIDFRVDLPRITQLLIEAMKFTCNYWFLLGPFYLLGFGLVFYMVLRYFGWIHFDLPLIEGFTRRMDTSRILDALALGVGRQKPLSECLAMLADTYPKRSIRQRLRVVVQEIGQGSDWCESLRRQKLIRQPEFAILQASQRMGNLPWAMREMADSSRRRLACRVQALCQVLFPPLIILMGLAVGFIFLALFLPLICLIQRLT